MSLFKNILIPTDFSGAAWEAVQIGLDLAGGKHSKITLLHIFPYSAKFDHRKGRLNDKDLAAINSIKMQLNEFCDDLAKKVTGQVASTVLPGGVEAEILRFIAENQFDLIVMGVNSTGVDNHPGSHLTNIIEKSSVPVLVVPNKLAVEKILA